MSRGLRLLPEGRIPDRKTNRARLYVSAAHEYHQRPPDGKALTSPILNTSITRLSMSRVLEIGPRISPDCSLLVRVRAGRAQQIVIKLVVDLQRDSVAVNTDGSWKTLPGEWSVPEGKTSGKNFRNGEGFPRVGRRSSTSHRMVGKRLTAAAWRAALKSASDRAMDRSLIAQRLSRRIRIAPVGGFRRGRSPTTARLAGMPRILFQMDSRQVVKVKMTIARGPTARSKALRDADGYQYAARRAPRVPPYCSWDSATSSGERPANFDGSIRMIMRHNAVEQDASFECLTHLNATWDLVKHR
jgi:hypothetical protein